MEYKFVRTFLFLHLISGLISAVLPSQLWTSAYRAVWSLFFYILLVNSVAANDLQTTSNHSADNFWACSINQHLLHTKIPPKQNPHILQQPHSVWLRIAGGSFHEEVWGSTFPSCRWIAFNCSHQFLPWHVLWCYATSRSSSNQEKKVLLCRKYRNVGQGCFRDVQWAHSLVHDCEKFPVLVIFMEIQSLHPTVNDVYRQK